MAAMQPASACAAVCFCCCLSAVTTMAGSYFAKGGHAKWPASSEAKSANVEAQQLDMQQKQP